MEDCQKLKAAIDSKGLRIVALDLPTSHEGMQDIKGDEFTGRMLAAIYSMLVEMMIAIARKDYEQRRECQAQGIEKAKAAGKYQGRPEQHRSAQARDRAAGSRSRNSSNSPARQLLDYHCIEDQGYTRFKRAMKTLESGERKLHKRKQAHLPAYHAHGSAPAQSLLRGSNPLHFA